MGVGRLKAVDGDRGRQNAISKASERSHKPAKTRFAPHYVRQFCECPNPWHGGERMCAYCGKSIER